MEQQPHDSDEHEPQQPLPDEDLEAVEVEPGQARRIIEDGMTVAEAVGQCVEDWVARADSFIRLWHATLLLACVGVLRSWPSVARNFERVEMT